MQKKIKTVNQRSESGNFEEDEIETLMKQSKNISKKIRCLKVREKKENQMILRF